MTMINTSCTPPKCIPTPKMGTQGKGGKGIDVAVHYQAALVSHFILVFTVVGVPSVEF